jgi:hypothetical protein
MSGPTHPLSFLARSTDAATSQRETPSLLDELHGIEGLLDRPPTREALLTQLFELEMEIAREHHRQQVAEHEFDLERRERSEQQTRCLRWLRVGLAYAIGALVLVAVAVAVFAVIGGRIDPLELLPTRGWPGRG